MAIWTFVLVLLDQVVKMLVHANLEVGRRLRYSRGLTSVMSRTLVLHLVCSLVVVAVA